MSTTAPVQLLVSVNGGAYLAGPQTALPSQTLAFKAASTAQLTSVIYEITDFPPGFPLPAGWSADPVSGYYFYAPPNVTTAPPNVTIPSSGPQNWGLFMCRLRGNNNPLQLNADGTPNTSFSPQLTDTSAVIEVASPNLGMTGLAVGLTTQLDSLRAWVGPLMQDLRLLDNLSSGGGPFSAGGDLGGTAILQNVLKVHGATVPAAGSLTTGNVLQVSSSSALTYGPLNVSSSNSVTGTLAPGNGGTGLSSVGANGTVLTVVSGIPAWVAPSGSFTAGGDLGGTSTSQNVLAVHGASVPIAGSLSTGNLLQVTGPSSLGYGPLNLAGGSNFVTGLLPAANQAAQTLSGDVTGLTSATVVGRINGASVPGSGALTVGNVLQVSGASALSYGPISLANPAAVTGSLAVSNGGTGLSALGTADQLLGMNHAGSSLAFFTTAGDLTLSSGSFTVVALQGNSVSTTAPTSGQVLAWNSGTSKWTPTTPGGGSSVTGSGFWHNTSGSLDAGASHGTAGQFATTNAGATDITWVSLSADVSASTSTPGQLTVVALQSHAVASTAPTEGQFLIQGASSWGPVSLSGDVSGSTSTPGLLTVTALQGFGVATTTPTSGQVLAWNSGTSKWTPTTSSAGASVTGSGFWHSTSGTLDAGASHGTAGQFAVTNVGATDATWVTLSGDLANSTGTAGLVNVTGIRGNPVSITAPTAGQVLVENAGATGSAWTSWSGDVSLSTSTPGQATVLAIHGATVPAAGALTTGNGLYVSGSSALTYSALNLAGGSGWVTGSLPVGSGGTGLSALGSADQLLGVNHAGSALAFFTLGGDGTLASGNLTVVAIQGNGIATTAPSNGQVLAWNSTTTKWTPTTPASTAAVTGSGIWHSTSGTLDGAASIGSAGQALFTNAGATNTAWVSISGDVSASVSTVGLLTVVGLQTHAVANTAPTEGQFLVQGASSWAPTSLSGDVSASVTTPGLLTVTALQGFGISTATPTSGQLLAWNSGTSKWTPTTVSTGGVSVTGSGVLHNTSGTLDSAASKGSAGQALFTNAGATDTAWTTFSGDVSASTSTAGKITVTGIQGNPVSGTSATAGQFLIENSGATGSAWTSIGGDVAASTSTPGSLTVNALKGATIPSLSAGLLQYTGSALAWLALPLAIANGGTGLSAGGTADQLLGMNHAGSALAYFTPSQDVSLTSGAFTVTGLRGNSVPAPSGTNTSLVWSGSALSWSTSPASMLPGSTFVFQPLGTAGANIYTTWSPLFTPANSVVGPVSIFFDGTFNSGGCDVPSGTWAFTNSGGVTWTSLSRHFDPPDFIVRVDNGAVVTGVKRFSHISVNSLSTGAASFQYDTSGGVTQVVYLESAILGNTSQIGENGIVLGFSGGGTGQVFVDRDSTLGFAGTVTVANDGTTLEVIAYDGAQIFSGSIAGPTANITLLVQGPGVNNSSGLPLSRVVYAGAAFQLSYNDSLVSPPLSATTVQAAIDALKTKTSGSGALAGDVTGAMTSNTVVKLTGSAGIVTIASGTIIENSGSSAASINLGNSSTGLIQSGVDGFLGPGLAFPATTNFPGIGHLQQTSDQPTTVLTISAQTAFAGATGSNKNGANLDLVGGNAASGGTPGGVVLGLGDGSSHLSLTKGTFGSLFLFDVGTSQPTFGQFGAGPGINGQPFTIAAQNGGSGNTNGGSLTLQAGASQGSGTPGTTTLVSGDSNAGMMASSTGSTQNVLVAAGLAALTLFSTGHLQFGAGSPSPTFGQAQAGSGSGNGLIVNAQDGASSGATNGGTLTLRAGDGANAGFGGNVVLQAGVAGSSGTQGTVVLQSGAGTAVFTTLTVGQDSLLANVGQLSTQIIGYEPVGTFASQDKTRGGYLVGGQITSSGGTISWPITIPTNRNVRIRAVCQARITVAGSLTSVNDGCVTEGTVSFANNAGVAGAIGGTTALNNSYTQTPSTMTPTLTMTASGAGVLVQLQLSATVGSLGTADCEMWIDAKYC